MADFDKGAVSPAAHARDQFAAKLKREMARVGWSQSDLGRRAGVGRDLVSTYVNARALPTSQTLARLADALGMDPQTLLGTPNADRAPLRVDYVQGGLRASLHGFLDLERAAALSQLVDRWKGEDGSQKEGDIFSAEFVWPDDPQELFLAKVDFDWAIGGGMLEELMTLFRSPLTQ